jgi:hypothetical protein
LSVKHFIGAIKIPTGAVKVTTGAVKIIIGRVQCLTASIGLSLRGVKDWIPAASNVLRWGGIILHHE